MRLDDRCRRVSSKRHHRLLLASASTYFVADFEAFGLDTSVGIGVDCDAWSILRSKHIIDFANELLVLSPDHTGEQGDSAALDHANDLTLTNVRNLSNHTKALGGTTVEAYIHSNEDETF